MLNFCDVRECLCKPVKVYIDEDGDAYYYCLKHYRLTVKICGPSKGALC